MAVQYLRQKLHLVYAHERQLLVSAHIFDFKLHIDYARQNRTLSATYLLVQDSIYWQNVAHLGS